MVELEEKVSDAIILINHLAERVEELEKRVFEYDGCPKRSGYRSCEALDEANQNVVKMLES